MSKHAYTRVRVVVSLPILALVIGCTSQPDNTVVANDTVAPVAAGAAEAASENMSMVENDTAQAAPAIDCQALAAKAARPNILGLTLGMEAKDIHVECIDPNSTENMYWAGKDGFAGGFEAPLERLVYQTSQGVIVIGLAGAPGHERVWGLSRIIKFDGAGPMIDALAADFSKKYGVSGKRSIQGNYMAASSTPGSSPRKYSGLACPQIQSQGAPMGDNITKHGAECGLYIGVLINSDRQNPDIAANESIVITDGTIASSLDQSYNRWLAAATAAKRKEQSDTASGVSRPTL